VFAAARKDEGRKWTYGSVGEKGSREGAKQACCREAAAILENRRDMRERARLAVVVL
jgi:hypothetical protein